MVACSLAALAARATCCGASAAVARACAAATSTASAAGCPIGSEAADSESSLTSIAAVGGVFPATKQHVACGRVFVCGPASAQARQRHVQGRASFFIVVSPVHGPSCGVFTLRRRGGRLLCTTVLWATVEKCAGPPTVLRDPRRSSRRIRSCPDQQLLLPHPTAFSPHTHLRCPVWRWRPSN